MRRLPGRPSGAPPPGLYAILTMRSEFLGACARFKGLAEAVNLTQYLLPQMERSALMRAIREPATLYDGEVSRELAERLIADAGGEQDELPLIQHGLMQFWRRKAAITARYVERPADAPPRLRPGDSRDSFRYDAGRAWRLGLRIIRAGGLADLFSDHADE